MSSMLTGNESVKHSVTGCGGDEVKVTNSKLVVESGDDEYAGSWELSNIVNIKRTRPNTPDKSKDIMASVLMAVGGLVIGALVIQAHMHEPRLLTTLVGFVFSVFFLIGSLVNIAQISNKEYSKPSSLYGVTVRFRDVNGVYFELYGDELQELVIAIDENTTSEVPVET